MANAQKLPEQIPSMGAELVKPYMEFEYRGKLYRLENLKGGHNSPKPNPDRREQPGDDDVVKACIANPPQWDEEQQRWIIPLENNLIEFDLSQQPEVAMSLPENSGLRSMKIRNNPSTRRRTSGYLVASGSKSDGPSYPVDSVFEVFIQVNAPGLPSLSNRAPFRIVANKLSQWPPEPGTVYDNLDDVRLYPDIVPFADKLMRPVVTILKGDQTVLSEVFESKAN
eukprot:TRINITY_DN16323_c0_g1_i2.p1 TRINITY_DN16323_c0_g1~~TRINITY_DN16323_c0_g1_i2.p1  ORF type:complete len:225 (-),score=23.93 TRINITY_DN16323_c0_g1_i2:170-844(-)